MTLLAISSLVLAGVPAVLVIRNLRVFAQLPRNSASAEDVSILIPARDEERNIAAAVEAALSNAGAEVLVLDDNSTDSTAYLVRRSAAANPRLRLLRGRSLPPRWCGKNWACAQLAEAATRPLLLFVDADVRLAPDAAATIAKWMRKRRVHLASGVPRQELGTLGERLLVPLIHFVLLGFLPFRKMRRSPRVAYAAACGQLMVADAAAYQVCGGHAAKLDRVHDALALAKTFRAAGLRTDLFDGTDLATCRMYRSNSEAWHGFVKNAHEGLGAPSRIVPATLMLVLGQVAPVVFLAIGRWVSPRVFICGAIGTAVVLTTRLALTARFHQPVTAALLHPIGILLLLAIQWTGLVRSLLGRPARWKSREYRPDSAGDRVTAADAGEHLPQRV